MSVYRVSSCSRSWSETNGHARRYLELKHVESNSCQVSGAALLNRSGDGNFLCNEANRICANLLTGFGELISAYTYSRKAHRRIRDTRLALTGRHKLVLPTHTHFKTSLLFSAQ